MSWPIFCLFQFEIDILEIEEVEKILFGVHFWKPLAYKAITFLTGFQAEKKKISESFCILQIVKCHVIFYQIFEKTKVYD